MKKLTLLIVTLFSLLSVAHADTMFTFSHDGNNVETFSVHCGAASGTYGSVVYQTQDISSRQVLFVDTVLSTGINYCMMTAEHSIFGESVPSGEVVLNYFGNGIGSNDRPNAVSGFGTE